MVAVEGVAVGVVIMVVVVVVVGYIYMIDGDD